MKLTIKERKLLEYVLLSELDHKEDDLRRYERRLRIDKDILRELKSDVKILNSIKAKFLKAKIIEEEDL